MRKKFLISLLISLIALGAAITFRQTSMHEFLELKTFDLRAQFREKYVNRSTNVVLVLVDEASLRTLKPVVGRWPWPRSLFADVLDFLNEAGAKLVVFDILFTETQQSRLGTDDQALVSSTEAGRVIHAFQILDDPEDELNSAALHQPMPPFVIERFSLKDFRDPYKYFVEKSNNFYLPFTELLESSYRIGVVNFTPDRDGVFRRTRLVRFYQDHYYPTLAYAAVQGGEIPYQKDGSYLINPTQKFTAYSIGGLLATIQKINEGDFENLLVDPSEFKDKIVLIGASAAGTYDLVNTPLGGHVPGVMTHASIIENMLTRSFLIRAPQWIDYVAAFGLTTLLCLIVLQSTTLAIQIAAPLIGIFGYVWASFLVYRFLVVTNIVFPVSWVVLGTVGSFVFSAFTEGKGRRRVRGMLAQYVSPAVLSEVMDKADDILQAEVGATREVTIFFSDIRGFTTLSETNDPKQTVEMLNYYFREMIDIVFKHNGTLDKFIGDAVMAFWGAPIRSESHAKDAVASAMEMKKKLVEINTYFQSKNYPTIKIGMGVHTGNVILGNIGSEKKLEYTIIGDNVNLASRLEGLTKHYGVDMLISETTYEKLKAEIVCRVVDAVRVKGKNKPIRIYQPFDNAPDTVREFDSAFSHYQQRRWLDALAIYKNFPEDPVAQVFIERCAYLQANPPGSDWDGVYTLKEK